MIAAAPGGCGDEWFASSYAQARSRFLVAAARAGATLRAHRLEGWSGPAGEELVCDVATLRAPGGAAALVWVSGTHGVEGFCGSACQLAILGSRGLARRARAGRLTLVFVHALNPFGFAHLRRTNEDNVDVNRNFVDHAAAHPANPLYALLHPALVPASWTGEAKGAADRRLQQVLDEHGARAVQRAITSGQYERGDGLFYGGRRPVWSNRLWRRILREELGEFRRVVLVDLHSGLGAKGESELIHRGGRDDGSRARAEALFGRVTSSEDGTSSSTEITGNMAGALYDELPGRELTPVTLEFGTHPPRVVLEALRADQWLAGQAVPPPALRARIAAGMRAAFLCDEAGWRRGVLERVHDLAGAAIHRLTGSTTDEEGERS
jgi:hypothetical protein